MLNLFFIICLSVCSFSVPILSIESVSEESVSDESSESAFIQYLGDEQDRQGSLKGRESLEKEMAEYIKSRNLEIDANPNVSYIQDKNLDKLFIWICKGPVLIFNELISRKEVRESDLPLLPDNGIQYLGLNCSNLHIGVLKKIIEKYASTLKELDIEETQFKTKDDFSVLKKATNLEMLNASHVPFIDLDVVAGLSNLKKLVLTQMTDEQIKSLQPLERIETLQLHHASITDQGISFIIDNFKSLKELIVPPFLNNAITPNGFKAVEEFNKKYKENILKKRKRTSN